MHWLYRIIPRERPRWFDPRLLTWVLLGNEEDGLFGPPYEGRGTFYPPTLWGAIRWAVRNPFHNLLFHVLAWPGGPFWKWGKVPGWNGYIGFRPPKGVFGIAIRKETTLGISRCWCCCSSRPLSRATMGNGPTSRRTCGNGSSNLMQPDNAASCCGEADAYEADSFEVEGDHYVAIITDGSGDLEHRKPAIPNGTRVPVPNHKMKWNEGNPTGHGILFIGRTGLVFCYVTPGGV
jgi:hypothetical protein